MASLHVFPASSAPREVQELLEAEMANFVESSVTKLVRGDQGAHGAAARQNGQADRLRAAACETKSGISNEVSIPGCVGY